MSRACQVAVSATIGLLLTVVGSGVTAQEATYSYTPVNFPGGVMTVVNGVNRAYYNSTAATNTLTPLTTFGTPTSTAGQRIVQLAGKVTF